MGPKAAHENGRAGNVRESFWESFWEYAPVESHRNERAPDVAVSKTTMTCAFQATPTSLNGQPWTARRCYKNVLAVRTASTASMQ